MKPSALMSPCRRYRYTLRRWFGVQPSLLAEPGRPGIQTVCFVMLNPSTADANQDDPTIRKCIGFAKRLGFGGLVVVNLYALRETDPKRMLAVSERSRVGEENDTHIGFEAQKANAVIAAWGKPPATRLQAAQVKLRAEHVRNLIAPTQLYALATTADGHPRHPLMLSYNDDAGVPRIPSLWIPPE